MFEKETELEKEAKKLFDKKSSWYAMNPGLEIYTDGFKEGYNKGKEDVKYDLMMKLKDEGIVKPLKDSILRNERLSSQEQQELCAWIECAMDFGENLDECAKELEQIRNERNLFQEKCEDIEFQFLSRNKWHYPSKGELPKCDKEHEWHYVNWKYFADKDYPESELALYLVRLRNKDVFICEWETEEGFGCFWDNNLEPIDNDDIYAWKEIVLPKVADK